MQGPTHESSGGESSPPPGEFTQQRQMFMRNIRRASLAGVLALAVVVGLTLAVVWKARQSAKETARANGEAEHATRAQAEADQQLWVAQLNEARAVRITGGPGARVRAASIIEALAKSPHLSGSQRIALRSEAIAQFTLMDVAPPDQWITGEIFANPERGLFVRHEENPVVEVRRFADSRFVIQLRGPTVPGNCFFSPHGRVLFATFKTDPTCAIAWRIDDGVKIFSNTVAPGIFFGSYPPIFSSDEKFLAFNSSTGLEVRTLADGTVLRTRAAATTCGFSPDNRWLACATGKEVTIEDTLTGKLRLRLAAEFNVTQLAWRPRGEILGLAGDNGAVCLVQLPPAGSSAPLRWHHTEGHGSSVTYAGFSPDGAAFMTASWDGFSIFWDALNGRRLLAETRQLLHAFSPADNKALAILSYPHQSGLARVLPRVGYRTAAALAARPSPPTRMRLSSDGNYLAVDNNSFTILFDALTGEEIVHVTGKEMEFAQDSRTLFTCADDTVNRFDIAALRRLAPGTVLQGGDVFVRTPPGTRANSLSVSSDGQTLVVCASDRAVLLVNITNAALQRQVEVAAHYARLSPDGETLVTQFHNGSANLIQLGTTNQITSLGQQLNTAFDPSGHWLGVGSERSLDLFARNATHQWECQRRLPVATGVGSPPPFAFSPDGKMVAVVFNRFDVHLYETETTRLLAELHPAFPAQIEGTAGLAFSADDRELFALKQDGEVIAWNLPVLQQELERLGLNWNRSETAERAPTASRPRPTRRSFWEPVAVIAGGLALLAGVVVFALQRRMLNAYAAAEELAEAHQRKLVAAQLALAHSQRLEALGTLAAGIAHDFNNLLSVIRMSNHFVAAAVKPEGTTRENIEAIEQAVAQGRDLVRSMLGYARRADDPALEFSVVRVVSDTLGMLSRQFLNGITLTLELEPACPPVKGSGSRLEQILLNLVINASEATRGQGQIKVSTRLISLPTAAVLPPAPAKHYIELSVTDNGPGIPPEILTRVFEPFFSTKVAGAQPGNGLGLSVVYTLARQSGWGLDVASMPGKPSCFRVLLPVSDRDALRP